MSNLYKDLVKVLDSKSESDRIKDLTNDSLNSYLKQAKDNFTNWANLNFKIG